MNKKITREQLSLLITTAKDTDDWLKVETANVSDIKDMSNLFENINQIESLDLSTWDTSSVTSMSRMFTGSNFNTPIFFDTTNVTNMSHMFWLSKYNYPLDSFDTSNVVDMSFMFAGSKYNHPLSSFNTSNVTDMSSMFSYSKYNHPLDSFNTSNVTDISFMFCEAPYNHPFSLNTDSLHCFNLMFERSLNISRITLNDIVDEYADGYDEFMDFIDRNERLYKFLNGHKNNIDSLVDDFSDNEVALSLIKKASLNNIVTDSNIKDKQALTHRM